MKKIIIPFLLIASLNLKGQEVIGYWYGSANVVGVNTPDNYLVELILKQNKSSVQGILNYYFRNTYRSMKINGNYNAGTRQLSLFNIPVPYYGSNSSMEVDCQMDFVATHRIAKAGSNLVGRFMGRENYKYTCPELAFDLRLNEAAGNQDSILLALQNFKETYQLWTPSATDTFVAATVIQRPIQNLVVAREFKERQLDLQKELENVAYLRDAGTYRPREVQVLFFLHYLGQKLLLTLPAGKKVLRFRYNGNLSVH